MVITDPSTLGAGNAVTDVDVATGGELLRPVLYGRMPLAFVRPVGPSSPHGVPQVVRVYLSASSLEPSDGRLPAVSLRIWRDALTMVVVSVPDDVVARQWDELLPWRLDQRRGAILDNAAAVPTMPAPRDSALRVAIEMHRRGATVEGAELAAAWRTVHGSGRATRERDVQRDQVIADMLVGGALVAGHDTNAAIRVVDDALALAPCLTVAPAAHPYQQLVTRRRVARCTIVSSGSVAAMGLLLPGGGHLRTGDRRRAFGVMSAVGVTLGAAGAASIVSAREYTRYGAARSVDGATRHFQSATAFRHAAAGLAFAAAVEWMADAGVAIVRERRHARRVHAEAIFGSSDCETLRCSR